MLTIECEALKPDGSIHTERMHLQVLLPASGQKRSPRGWTLDSGLQPEAVLRSLSLVSISPDRKIRQVLHRLGELVRDRLQRQPDVALHHEVQMRPGAVAGVA